MQVTGLQIPHPLSNLVSNLVRESLVHNVRFSEKLPISVDIKRRVFILI